MKYPEKWRETADPFALPYRAFALKEVLGYPHAGNDVFQVRGVYRQQEVEAFVKVARQRGADVQNEIDIIAALGCPLAPQVIDHDAEKKRFVVTLAKPGERLSTLLGENADMGSLKYLYEYGQTLAKLHATQGDFPAVKDRRFFHIPARKSMEEKNLTFVHDYLTAHRPENVNICFCHGDFHYANILWENGHMSAILDFELSGCGNREFDIAWALILRPGQRFLRTEEEIALFMEGYRSCGVCDMELVRYYMVQIYTYFWEMGDDMPEYREHILSFFQQQCTE